MEPSPPPLPARQIGVLGLGQLQLLLQPGLLHEAWGWGRCTARGRGGLGSGITRLRCILPPSRLVGKPLHEVHVTLAEVMTAESASAPPSFPNLSNAPPTPLWR